jgi:SAM-dependent methyltransferase
MSVRDPGMPEGLPPDYYERLYEVEEGHWWQRGMRSLTEALLADRLARRDLAVLDAGCGAGGFLRWLTEVGSFRRVCGADISSAAVELARRRLPRAELVVAPLRELPFEDAAFDLVLLNDVLQHVREDQVEVSLLEVRRVLRRAGTLFVRTNGAARARRERVDWRVYDRRGLVATLEQGGFHCERVTYANLIGALWALARRSGPHAPTDRSHGIPRAPHPIPGALAASLLRLEARYLRSAARTLPFGHSLLALAHPEARSVT